jgi:secreted Zn-dependent insulinase-like peptidase
MRSLNTDELRHSLHEFQTAYRGGVEHWSLEPIIEEEFSFNLRWTNVFSFDLLGSDLDKCVADLKKQGLVKSSVIPSFSSPLTLMQTRIDLTAEGVEKAQKIIARLPQEALNYLNRVATQRIADERADMI